MDYFKIKLPKTEDGLYVVKTLSDLQKVKNEVFVFAICPQCKGGWTSLIANADKILQVGCLGCIEEGKKWEAEMLLRFDRQNKYEEINNKSGNEIDFKRGDKVDFAGVMNYKPLKGTYVWAINDHLMINYVIQHPNGKPKSYFINPDNDGFECIHERLLDDKLNYIYVFPNEIKKSE